MAQTDNGDVGRYGRLMKEALVELESLQTRFETLRRAHSEPIAVVGLGCRFPGGANSPREFWSLLCDGVDAVDEVRPQRWDLDVFYDPDVDAPGKVYCRNAALVDQSLVEGFSPEFFGIAPREARCMDPQQRMLLEVCWEALEDAAVPPDGIRESRTGLFVGSCTDDYLQLFNNLADPARIEGYSSLGTARCITVGRVSHLLGLEGPAIQFDTACSSSLVAVHQACASLRSGECEMTLAGGVNLQLSPVWTIGLCKLKALAPDGRCKTFDAAANGFGRGEGCGILVLKRLSDALEAGDPIRALIRGAAINHDGHSGGLTVPSQMAQEKLLRQAQRAARVRPDEIDYVEAHGTGTGLGDPIEMGALASVFSDRTRPIWVGSVKTNIGHLEGAAGVAGLIKAILSLEHEAIPPHLHFQRPNPHIAWKDFNVRVPTQPTPWLRSERARLTGVSSFGFSGTNAHVILQEAPLRQASPKAPLPCHLLVFSAKCGDALQDLAHRWLEALEDGASLRLGDACFSAATGRAHFAHRVAVLGDTREQVCRRLRAHLDKKSPDGVWYGEVERPESGRAAWPRREDIEFTDRWTILAQAADRYVRAVPVQWSALYREAARSASLPTYPFQRQRYWLEPSREPSPASLPEAQETEHPLLGRRVYAAAAPETVTFETRLAEDDPAYFADHRVEETAVVPATALLEMALAAGRSLTSGHRLAMQDVAFHRALVLPPGETQVVQIILMPEPPGYRFELFSRGPITGGRKTPEWTRHASGKVVTIGAEGPSVAIDELRRGCAEQVPTQAVYERIARQGLRYGPSFRLLQQVAREPGKALGLVGLPEDPPSQTEGYWLHPAMLDACLHVIAGMPETDLPGTIVPVHVDRVEVFGLPGTHVWSHATLRPPDDPLQTDGFTVDVDLLDTRGSRIARLEGLRMQQVERTALVARPATDPSIELYEVQWRPADRAAEPMIAESGSWLVLADHQGVAEALAEKLAEQGHGCHLIWPGEQRRLACTGPDGNIRGQVRPDALEDLADLLRELGSGEQALQGIVHLWSLDLPNDHDDAFAVSHSFGCGSALRLLQAMAAMPLKPRLWLVTNGAQCLGTDSLDESLLAQSPLWGLGRVAAREHPEIRAIRVDLDPKAARAVQAEALLAELLSPDAEDQVASRQSVRYAPRLVRWKASEHCRLSLAGGSVLVTGGLGEIGLRVAEWLASQGAGHIVLSSRHGPQTDRQRQAVDRVRQHAKLDVLCADLSSRPEVERLLATIRRTLPPLRGVVHAAGVLDDAMLRHLDWPRFERVMRPKVGGAWHLHRLAGSLDFFVMFSSAVGMLGSPGQANYAAANVFLDSLAYYRRKLGQPALSIAWGPWQVGMTARMDDRLRKRWERSGLQPIRPPGALQVLDELLAGSMEMTAAPPPACVAAMALDWDRFAASMPESSLWSELIPQLSAAPRPPAPWRQRLDQSPSSNRRRLLIDFIRSEVASVLGWQSADQVKAKQNLFDLGMDSLTSVELETRLEKNLGCSLPLTLAFDYPNVQALAAYILERLSATKAAPAPQRRQPLPEDAQRLAQMSEQEVESLLIDKYESLLRSAPDPSGADPR